MLWRLPSSLSSNSTSERNLRSVNAEIELLLREALTLRALKVEYGQGYHFGKPLDAEAAEAMIAARPVW